MATRAKTRSHRPAPARLSAGARTSRTLLEQFGVSASNAPALKIDRDRGIIYGVKVLGRYSKNSHGLAEAENGTEYSVPCMRQALPMYEGAKVKLNHPPDRSKPAAERDVDDIFGVLRNARIESEEDGVRADLHYRKHHKITEDVLDDVERQLGLWGLSHNAAARRERFDPGAKRLIIEELAQVRSVDLVDKPATTRNLWESEGPMTKTVRELLEGRRPKLSKLRQGWLDHLLEMYEEGDAAMMAEAPPAEGGDENDALWTGFQSAIQKVLDSYKAGECDSKEAGKKIADWIKAHDKLTGTAEPEEVPEEEEEEGEKGKEKEKMESELTTLRACREKARELCESLGVTPTTLQVKAVAGLSDDKERRQLVESFKSQSGKPSGFKSPKSQPAGSITRDDKKKPGNRETTESEEPKPADTLRTLRGD